MAIYQIFYKACDPNNNNNQIICYQNLVYFGNSPGNILVGNGEKNI